MTDLPRRNAPTRSDFAESEFAESGAVGGGDDQDSPDVGTVPAGGSGADSGSADAVAIEGGDTAEIPDRSWGNDAPGVGTRGPGDSNRVESAEGDRQPPHPDADEAPLPDMHDEREDPRVEGSLARRLRRDAGPDAARAAADPNSQSRPKMAQHVATIDQQVWGVFVQTRTDFPTADFRRLREVLQERLCQVGIDMPADDVEHYLRRHTERKQQD